MTPYFDKIMRKIDFLDDRISNIDVKIIKLNQKMDFIIEQKNQNTTYNNGDSDILQNVAK